jgi:hypothetical protein
MFKTKKKLKELNESLLEENEVLREEVAELLQEKQEMIDLLEAINGEASEEKLKEGYFALNIDRETNRELIGFYSDFGVFNFFAVYAKSVPAPNGFVLEIMDPYADVPDYYLVNNTGAAHELKATEGVKRLFESDKVKVYELYPELKPKNPIGFSLEDSE